MKDFLKKLMIFVWRHRQNEEFVCRQLQHLTAAIRANTMGACCGSQGRLHDDILETWIEAKHLTKDEKVEAFVGVTEFWAEMRNF